MVNKKRLVAITLAILMLVMETLSLFSCGTKDNPNGATTEPSDQNVEFSFSVDGENYATITVTEEDKIQLPEAPTKEGYAFDGWYLDKDVWKQPFTADSSLDISAGDMSVYAKFTPIAYSISYEMDGGTHNNPATYTIESSFEFANAQKAGYTFLGWYTDATYTTQIKSISAGTTGDMTLYAKFELATYSITYENTKGAENTNPSTYTINSETITFSPLSKDGYTFGGWYVGDTKVMEISKGSTGNLTLTAKWDTIGYTITYHNVTGATHNNPDTYDVEDQHLTLSAASKAGYKFVGWYTDEALTNMATEIAVGTTGNLNLYAKWEVIEYTATFKDGNTVVDTVTFTVETESITPPAVPEHTGYTGAWESYTLGTEDITINAVYTLITYGIVYHNVDGAINNNPSNYDVEDQPLALVDASKDYYIFKGWYTDAEFSNKVTEIAVGTTGVVNLYAKWEAIEYTATFKDGDTVVGTVKFTVETDSITPPDVPEHAGYNGVWESYTLGAEDITINAVYTLITYNIVYHNVDGVTNNNPSNYDVEDQPLALVDASKDYYTFKGWYTDAEFNNKVTEISVGTIGVVNLYAKWEAIEYTAIFKDGDTIVDSVTFTVETESITPPAVPEHTGYTGAWESYTLGHEDITINAVYTPITYSITYTETKGAANSNVGTYTIESETIILAELSAVGYTFDGWYDGDIKVTQIAKGRIGNLTLTAKWTPITYTITYTNTKDATNTNVVEYTIESEKITLADISVDGYIFGGWYSGETKVTEIASGSTGNISLTAKWTAIDYTITYHNVADASHSNLNGYSADDQPIILNPASKVGYRFVGWCTDEALENVVTEISVGTIGNLNLYAKWEIIEYTATFKDGDTIVDEIKFTVETVSITEPNVPAHAGYTGKWESYTLGTNNITVNAVYELVTYGIIYHNVTGATHSNPSDYDVEDEPIVLQNATKDYYNFVGWYTDAAFQNQVTEIAIGNTGVVNLYAKWDAIEYTATFKDRNTIVDTIKFTVETESITAPAVPAHAGYTGKWESYTLGTEDIVINAVYTAIVYTIEYENTKNITHGNTISYTVESNKITLSDLTLAGYEFVGWFDGDTRITEIPTGSTGNITLTARWNAIKYNIYFLYDDTIGDYADANKNPVTYTIEDEFDYIALVNHTVGYTFDGWFTEKNIGTGTQVTGITKGTMGDITVYAHFGLEEYEIIYNNVNGATNTNPTYYTVESDDFTIYPLSKEGYTFDGWFSDVDCTIPASLTIVKGSHGAVTLYAKWTPIVYTIEYVTYGGTATGNPSTFIVTDTVTFNDASRSGYVFRGWYTAAEGGSRVTEIVAGTTGNVVLYAHWDYISTISFNSNGGSSVGTISNVEGTTISAPTAPSKTHYTFAGWYSDSALTEKYTFSVQPETDITLYAKWTPVQYQIVYVTNGGSHSNRTTYTVEDSFTLTNASKTGHTFVAWFTDAEFTSAVVSEIKAGTSGTITLYANYSINQYTISFEENGGTTVENITQNYATSVTAPEAPAKNGYTFAGWYTNSALTSKYSFSTMPARNITLYAKWNLVTYDITYNLNGGSNNVSNPATYAITGSKITLGTPTKTGYTFAGWYTDAEYNTAITEIASGSYGDVELFAKWGATEYTVTYVVKDGASHSNTAIYTIETDLITLTDATLKGYTFNGWYADSAYNTRVSTIAGGEIDNITLYAKFTANTYNVWLDGTEEASFDVSFNLNGADGSISTQTITPTKTLKYPTVPTRNGYIFAGWYDNAACTGNLYDFTALITKDITLYAKWVESASSVSMNGTANVTLNGKEEQRFTFVPLVSGNVTLTTTGSYDTLGILYDEAGNLLSQDDDTGTDDNFQIVFNVTAGKAYTIAVRGFSTAVNGTVTLHVSGNNTVTAGGYVITGNKATVTYDESFTLALPDAREGYKFLGYADTNGVMYTDANGNSVKVWDKDADTLLVSVWERTVYTVTFVTSGGTPIDTVTLAYGDRLDISKYVTTRDGYTFNGWYLDGVEYNATIMPDHNITLTAYWKTFALGTIKYDTDKKAISVNDTITPELFGALCLDTNGNKAEFTVAVNGTQAAGETITVRLTATSGGKTKVITITDIKVYGMPTLTFDNTVDYFNINGGLTASHFGASGTDTFGVATQIKVYVDGEYEAGDRVKIVIESIDPAENITYGYINNVKAYGLPEIAYNENKTAISVNDTLNAELFGATAKDSFGNDLDVSVEVIDATGLANGDVYNYNTSTTKDYKYFTALNSETYKLHYKNGASGDRTYIMVYCVTTGSTIKSASYYTNYSSYSTMTFSVTAGYEYYICTYAYSSSYTTSFSMYLTKTGYALEAGQSAVIRISAIDSKGNVKNTDVEYAVYGTPVISSATKTDVKSDDTVTPELLGIAGTDTYGKSLTVLLTTKDGSQTAGTVWTVTATVTDAAGNISTKDFELKVYGTPTISYDRNAIKVTDDVTTNPSNILNANAKDSFGKKLTITATVKSGNLTAGTNIIYTLTVIDHLGNTHSIDTDPIGVYDIADIKFNHDSYAGRSDIIKLTSKGEEFDVKATDSFGNLCDITIEAATGYTLKGGETITLYLVATDKAGNRIKSEAINEIRVYDIPTVTFNQNNCVIYENTSIPFLFVAHDSFGEELYADITVIGNQITGNTVMVTISATDNASNTILKQYTLAVLSEGMSFVELYVDGDLWKNIFVDLNSNYTLPFPEIQGNIDYGLWYDEEGNLYTDLTGKGVMSLPENVKLYHDRYIPITTRQQLQEISMDQKYFLTQNINLQGIEWIPIGTAAHPFSGVFDGNGYIVSNFKITNSQTYAGLFGMNNGRIKNLGVENFTINSASASGSTVYGGSVVAYNGSKGLIMNCYAIGDVAATVPMDGRGSAYNGVLNGYNMGEINNCHASGSASGGGLVGYNSGSINNSYATGAGASGGLAGINAGTINKCHATGDSLKGGLVGSNSGTIKDSYAIGNVSTSQYAGGLVGNNTGTISNSYAKGTATGTSTSSSSSYAGGLVGYNTGTISKSYATGNASGSYAGGLVGYNTGTISNCSATGIITNSSFGGGLIGYHKYGTVSGSYATGSVSCSRNAGGLIGYAYDNNEVENCYATGNVSVSNISAEHAGGLIGFAGLGTDIINCYATGNVSSSAIFTNTSAGGLVGYLDYGSQIVNSYATGNVTTSNANCLGGGLCGGSDELRYVTIKNSYRCSSQSIKATTVTTHGTAKELSILKSADFKKNTLGWYTSIWNIVDGSHPTLRSAASEN